MIDWTKIHDALKSCFEKNTGVSFIWENEATEFLEKPYGVLSIAQSSAPWRDDVYIINEDGDYVTYLVGARDINVNIQIFSRSHLPTESARYFLEMARTELRKPGMESFLKNAGLMLLETHPVVDLTFTFDNRKESRAAFDALFRFQEVERDKTGADAFFDHVHLKGAVR